MQYLVSVIFDRDGLATEDEQAAIDVFNDRLMAEGHWVFAGGLGAPSSATVIDHRGGEALFTDGPFQESKEFLAGFWMLGGAETTGPGLKILTGIDHDLHAPGTPANDAVLAPSVVAAIKAWAQPYATVG